MFNYTKRVIIEEVITMDYKTIGQRLISLRGNKSLTDVAKDLKISISALSMYENDKRVPRDEVKKQIADYYHTSVEMIFFA